MRMKKEDQRVSIRNAVRGGVGDVSMREFIGAEDAFGAGRLFAVTTIPPGGSIGYHEHVGEFEIYYMLAGTARVRDDGETYEMREGDAMICRPGSSHGIENIGGEPVEFVALILFPNEGHRTGAA